MTETSFASAGFTGNPEELIPLLQHVQREEGYLSRESCAQIADFLGIALGQVYTVAAFYAQFRFRKPGKHHVRVCQGTACHVQGGGDISREAQKILGIAPGETTPDGEYDLEEVACLGCCAQAAVVETDGVIHAQVKTEALREILR